jgi:hypothetical protein
MGRPLPGHARAVELKGGYFRCGSLTIGQLQCLPMIPVSIEPERYRMKKRIELLNLIAALIRLADVIIRTGWF